MPNYGSKKQNTGGTKIKDGTEGNYDMGQLDGFRTNKGAAREGKGLANDTGAGGGKFKDTNNDASGAGHGGAMKRPRAGDS